MVYRTIQSLNLFHNIHVSHDEAKSYKKAALSAAINIYEMVEYSLSLRPLGSWSMTLSLPVTKWMMLEGPSIQSWSQSALEELNDAGSGFNFGEKV